ncbi:unnamed protein product [Candida verbasci]|uniref:Uncharacterized protein n=1 Tax=Candida verbasci TaxID=1227364 RepID=A0A9W4XD29_9ASCO|nr:unnamed protein product [Candida verbasci]
MNRDDEIQSPPPSYASHIISDIGSSAPIQFLNNLITDESDQIERVEHFKYKQQLERKLTVTSVIGLGFSVMGVPFGLSSTLWIGLMDGANVTILYGWLTVSIFSLFVVLSLSEIISKFPSAGGVYHFSALLSNEKYASVASWFCGWLLIIGNWTYAISIMFSGSQFILSIFGLKDVQYKEDRFWVLGVFYLLLAFSGFINFKFSKYLEKINKLCILWTIYAVLVIDFLLIFFAKRTNSIKTILTTFDNSRSGWPDPLAFLIGLQSSSFSLTGYGMLFSITDEVKNPEKNMPKGAISAILIAAVTGFIFIIPILTILPELELLLDNKPNIMPIDLIFKISTESYIISFLMACLLIGTIIFQSIGSLTTASRSTYALARDNGLPYSEIFTEVNSIEQYIIPRNALFLSMIVCAILAILSLVSSSAFNAFMGAAVGSLALANGIPIFCLMMNKRQKIKGSVFKLKKLGWVINFISLFWIVLSIIILCMPPVIKHLNFQNFNYAIFVMISFLIMVGVIYKVWGYKSFTGPQIDTDYFELNSLENSTRIEDAVPNEDEIDSSKIEEADNESGFIIEQSKKKKKKGYDRLGDDDDDDNTIIGSIETTQDDKSNKKKQKNGYQKLETDEDNNTVLFNADDTN